MKDYPEDFFRPFDLMYKQVKNEIDHFTDSNWAGSERTNWVRRLNSQFAAERDLWPLNPLRASTSASRNYIAAASRLQFKALRLTACAYLHICYDLPRVLANEWPGTGQWGTLDEATAEGAFIALEAVFPIVASDVLAAQQVTGFIAPILFILPRSLMKAASTWLFRLRLSAWNHARILRGSPDRAVIERRMIRALTAAIKDVVRSGPWTAPLLGPPDREVYPFLSLIPLSALADDWPLPVRVAGIIEIVVLLLGIFLFRRRRIQIARFRDQMNKCAEFVSELGRRIEIYLEQATSERGEESFNDFLRARGHEPSSEDGPPKGTDR